MRSCLKTLTNNFFPLNASPVQYTDIIAVTKVLVFFSEKIAQEILT